MQPSGESSRGWWVGKGNFNWFELVIQIISAFFSIYILILSAFNGLVEDFLFAPHGNNSCFSARYCRPEFSLWGTKSGMTWEASQLGLLDCLTARMDTWISQFDHLMRWDTGLDGTMGYFYLDFDVNWWTRRLNCCINMQDIWYQVI